MVFSGGEHSSSKDKAYRVSGQIYKGGTRLTSVHVYADKVVVFSKDDYNDAQQ